MKRGRSNDPGEKPVSEAAAVSVAVVTSRTEAELIVGMLRGYDLRATVSADDAGEQYPALQTQGVRVLVAPADEASARRHLAAVSDISSEQVTQGRSAAHERAPRYRKD